MTLSVNILTYNGASAFIDKAIESVIPYVDEVLVYDTGSIDNTLEVLKRYPKGRVWQRDVQHMGETWTNSPKDVELTKMLNELKEASRGDWILKIDDDEIFPKELMLNILSIISFMDHPILSIPFIHIGGGGETFLIKRLFKNIPDVKWDGVYGNETLAWKGKRLPSSGCPHLEIPFYHLGGLRRDNDRKHNYDNF